ncbi:hypothetical protein C8R46DRAFT_1061124, partial [Mycena filopes]
MYQPGVGSVFSPRAGTATISVIFPILFVLTPTMADALVQTFQEAFGTGLISGLLAMGMYGLTTAQTYYYFIEYPKDKMWTKVLVWTLWILNTVHSALMVHLIYHYLITNAFNLFQLSQNIWSLPVSMVVHLIAAFLVMLYFLSVIYRFSTLKLRWLLVVPTLCAILLHIGFGLASSVHILKARSLLDIPAFTGTSFLPMAIAQVAADVLLASCLCFVLYDQRSDFRRTNSIVNTLMIYAINRGLLTTGVAMCSLFMNIFKKKSLIYIGPELVMTGLYTNTLMASLNSRHRIRDANSDEFGNMHLSNIRSDGTAMESHHVASRTGRMDVAAPRPRLHDKMDSVVDLKQDL